MKFIQGIVFTFVFLCACASSHAATMTVQIFPTQQVSGSGLVYAGMVVDGERDCCTLNLSGGFTLQCPFAPQSPVHAAYGLTSFSLEHPTTLRIIVPHPMMPGQYDIPGFNSLTPGNCPQTCNMTWSASIGFENWNDTTFEGVGADFYMSPSAERRTQTEQFPMCRPAGSGGGGSGC